MHAGERRHCAELRVERAGHLAAIVSVVGLCVVAMGVLQILYGLTRVGNLAKFVPQPVLAGFMRTSVG